MPNAQPNQPDTASSIKETLVSITIAFAMAFVFRGFVVEAFLIPTGSMAPTLLGQHMRFHGPTTGEDWSVGPWKYSRTNPADPTPIQSANQGNIEVHDPMSRQVVAAGEMPRRWGDRIFVMKYLTSVYEPARWDVVVFKNPSDPTISYIKRLLVLPNEAGALIDGDVFTRAYTPSDSTNPNPWAADGWKVQRKNDLAQDVMWQDVFSSEYTPIVKDYNNVTFVPPWLGYADGAPGKDWQIGLSQAYTYSGAAPAQLVWDTVRRPITDAYSYNETPMRPNEFPVGDIRLSIGVRPTGTGFSIAPTVIAANHEFRAAVDSSGVRLEMRPLDPPDGSLDPTRPLTPLVASTQPWKELARATLPAGALTPGEVTNIEFAHADQQLTLRINGARTLVATYDWSPAERVRFATGASLDDLLLPGGSVILIDGSRYAKPGARFDISGACTLYRVGLARDIFYRPVLYNQGDAGAEHSRRNFPGLGTHPSNTIFTNPEEFFFCGDNSPASHDARMWDTPSPWVQSISPNMGRVNRDLIIGKAFFVYFPAPFKKWGLPVPDFGDMRFIR